MMVPCKELTKVINLMWKAHHANFFFRAIITETAQKSLAPIKDKKIMPTLWFPRDTHCMDILGYDGNHISDLLSPSALPSISCIDDYERDNSILNTISLTWWSNRNTISLHCPALTWQTWT